MVDIKLYPVCIMEDRYGGAYSGGQWLAFSNADEMENGAYRIVRLLEQGPHGSDTDAMIFWDQNPSWIASGNTPQAALDALLAKIKEPKP